MTGIAADGIRVAFDARTGLLESFTVEDAGRAVAPLHRAPWVGTGEVMPPDAAPLMATLGGDFFCAPFAASEDGSALHGWPANTPWTVVREHGGTLRAVLNRPVMGATLVKELSVADGHPFVYQRHIFIGGDGTRDLRQPRQRLCPRRRAHPHLAQAPLGDAEDPAGKRPGARPLGARLPGAGDGPARLPGGERPRRPHDLPVEPAARGLRLRDRGAGAAASAGRR
jgi:hypothetical protein